MRKKTVREMYTVVYDKAWIYYGQEESLSDDQVNRAATKFAVKNTWREYNDYLKRVKVTNEEIS